MDDATGPIISLGNASVKAALNDKRMTVAAQAIFDMQNIPNKTSGDGVRQIDQADND